MFTLSTSFSTYERIPYWPTSRTIPDTGAGTGSVMMVMMMLCLPPITGNSTTYSGTGTRIRPRTVDTVFVRTRTGTCTL